MSIRLPDHLRERIERVHGERGALWAASLPALLEEFSARWSLELGEPFADLSYNFVVAARDSRGRAVVLKLGVPCAELLSEASALELFGGAGAVRLLDRDTARGALLLERALPGTQLAGLRDDAEATRTVARLMLTLWREPPAGHAFPTLAEWFRAFGRVRTSGGGGGGAFPPELIEKAERAFSALDASAGRAVILHGDLHHMNVLSSSRGGWLAIDPKGLCGDAAYEVGTFMLNRLPEGASDAELTGIMRRRLSIFSEELRIDVDRLAAWSFCHAVLSAVWSFEEGDDWRPAARLARVLE